MDERMYAHEITNWDIQVLPPVRSMTQLCEIGWIRVYGYREIDHKAKTFVTTIPALQIERRSPEAWIELVKDYEDLTIYRERRVYESDRLAGDAFKKADPAKRGKIAFQIQAPPPYAEAVDFAVPIVVPERLREA